MSQMSCPTVIINTPAGEVIINESDFDAATMERVIPLPPAAPVAAPPPPPAPPADPLAGLPADWQTGDPEGLKRLAAVVSGGRAVENVAQAVQVISAALAARGK